MPAVSVGKVVSRYDQQSIQLIHRLNKCIFVTSASMSTAVKNVFLLGEGCFSPPTIMHMRMFGNFSVALMHLLV